MPVSEKLRVFLAVWLSPTVVDALVESVEALQRETRRDAALSRAIRWIKHDAWHLTVVFVGSVDPAGLSDLEIAAKSAAARSRPFDIVLGKAGVFPGLRSPRVLWVGVTEGDTEWHAFAATVRDEVRRFLPLKREAGHVPHVTVARISRPADVGGVLERLGTLPPTRQKVDKLALVKSELLPAGARYETLAEYKLGGEVTADAASSL
jgi:2'-5' RNA ligase